MDTVEARKRRHKRIVALKLALLALWLAASFGACFFARDLQFQLGQWPFGFWLAAQGAMLVFTFVLAIDAWAMKRLAPDDEATPSEAGSA